MIEEHIDFIGIYKDVVPEGYCQHMIDQFNQIQAQGVGTNRRDFEGAVAHFKSDHAMFLERGAGSHFADFQNEHILAPFYRATQDCFNSYTEKFSVLKDNKITGNCAKMQKTEPGQGYHVWHGEQGPGNNAARVLTYMLYLNTLGPDDGGETEFLYQRLRVKPEAGTMLVWPAAFTHAHRGNVVLGGTPKFVITGWFYFD